MQLGFVAYFLIYNILININFGKLASFFLSTLFIVTPAVVLYENWLFYTWPIATLIAFTAYMLLLYEKTSKTKYGIIFFVSIGILCLTRSMFHIIYLLACIIGILFIRSPSRKKVVSCGFVVLMLVGSFYLKNYVLFGVPGTSSWVGMNLWKMVECDASEIVMPADSDVVSKPPFSDINKYPQQYIEVPERFSDIPVLYDKYKSNGAINFNYYGYINVSREYKKGFTYLFSHNFSLYLKNVVKGWGYYCKPSWYYWFLDDNRVKLQPIIDFISVAKPRFFIERKILGEDATTSDFPYSSYLFIPILLSLVCFDFLVNVFRTIKKQQCRQPMVFFSFMVLTVLFVAIMGNALEVGENNRFRVQTDILLYLAVIISIRDLWFVGTAGKHPRA